MIGSSTSLTPQASQKPPVLLAPGTPSPAPRPATAPLGGGKPAPYAGKVQKPRYIDMDTTEDAVNQAVATGWQNADSNYLTKKLTRPGVSTGKGQGFIAAQLGANAVSDSAQEAAGIRTADSSANAKMKSDYEKAQEDERQAARMAAHAAKQSQWSTQFAQQSAQAQIQMAMQQAQLQLMLALMNQEA